MVVDSHREITLCAILPYHVLVKEVTYLLRFGQFGEIQGGSGVAGQVSGRLAGTHLMAIVGQQLVNLVGTLGAEIHPGLDSRGYQHLG